MYEAESGEISIAVTGDTIPTRPLSVFREERFLAVRNLLRAADATFTNLEAPIHEYLDGGHIARSAGGGTYMTTEPQLLDELKWMGIRMLASGSSHADDYGPDGIVKTVKYLDQAGIVHAGSGRHLAEARAPGFLETPRGRVALVAAQGGAAARAGEQRRDTPGYPGTNGIRYREVIEVDQTSLEALMRIGRDIGLEAEQLRSEALGDPVRVAEGAYNFLGHSFVVGPGFARHTYANKSDLDENLRQIAYAKAVSDRVITSLHCHTQGGPTYMTAPKRSDVEDLADFAVDFAHQSIDAGADMFVGHGPQVTLGIEIYKDRPIFYGLGIFLFQLETVRHLPEEAYERYKLGDRATPFDFANTRYAGDTRGHPADPLQWEQVFTVCDFAGPAVKEIRLYPIELGFGRPPSQRGRPLLAAPETAERIIDRVRERSKKYGTEVRFENGIGVIRL